MKTKFKVKFVKEFHTDVEATNIHRAEVIAKQIAANVGRAKVLSVAAEDSEPVKPAIPRKRQQA